MAFLLKGAHVVDPQSGIDGIRDVLIEGDKIAQVAESIENGDAEVIDACHQAGVAMVFPARRHFRH